MLLIRIHTPLGFFYMPLILFYMPLILFYIPLLILFYAADSLFDATNPPQRWRVSSIFPNFCY